MVLPVGCQSYLLALVLFRICVLLAETGQSGLWLVLGVILFEARC